MRRRLYKGVHMESVINHKRLYDKKRVVKKSNEEMQNEKGIKALFERDQFLLIPFEPQCFVGRSYYGNHEGDTRNQVNESQNRSKDYVGLDDEMVKKNYSYVELTFSKGAELNDKFDFEYYYKKALEMCEWSDFEFEFFILDGVVYGLKARYLNDKAKGFKPMTKSKIALKGAKQPKTGMIKMLDMTYKIVNNLEVE